MKKLSKTLLAVAAVSAVSAAMAASAMAMDARYVDPETDPEGVGYVELTNVEANGKFQTLLIYKSEDGEGTFNTVDYTTDDIEGINQEDGDDANPGSVQGNIPVGDLAEGTYQVRVAGSEGTMQFASFEVTSGGGEDPDPGETITIVIGDATGDKRVAINDAAAIAAKLAPEETANNVNVRKEYNYVSGLDTAPSSGRIMVGDATLDGRVAINDAAAIATFLAPEETANNANVRKEVTVTEISE